jgi:predicted nucleic acid-binding protein
VKLVLREPEEKALRAEMAEWEGYVSSALLGLEAIRACSRHRDEYARDAREWLLDVSRLPLDNALLDDAATLAPATLRSLDAIHLATALSIRDEVGVFVTYDRRLEEAARSHGLNASGPGMTTSIVK